MTANLGLGRPGLITESGDVPRAASEVRPLSPLRRLTGWLRVLPDFLVIGAQRTGSTSLYFNLTQHPSVMKASRKEVHFFDRASGQAANWYRSHFPIGLCMKSAALIGRRPMITGEATPAYLFHPLVPGRVHSLLPQVKLIALLRNPVERAYSQYQMNIKRRFEALSFEDAIATEQERLRGDLERQQRDELYFGLAHRRFSYQLRGIYADQLQRWFQRIDRKQFLILDSKEFSANPKNTLEQVAAFLNLSAGQFGDYQSQHVASYSRMEPRTRERLVEFFKPHNQRLFQLLGREFDWE